MKFEHGKKYKATMRLNAVQLMFATEKTIRTLLQNYGFQVNALYLGKDGTCEATATARSTVEHNLPDYITVTAIT